MKTFHIVNKDLTEAAPETLFNSVSQSVDAEQQLSRQDSIVPLRLGDQDLVLKTYFRGGLPGRFIRKTYFYCGLERTRMWREFSLLLAMRERGLPVPSPLAARCQVRSLLTYSGDLMMHRINNSQTLAATIAKESLPITNWTRIGEIIADFHRHRVCHKDLNATNILLSEDDSIHLIDFDKCSLLSSSPGKWAQDNLSRLRRSLNKHVEHKGLVHFDEKHWEALITGYLRAL